MNHRISIEGLQISSALYDLIESEIAPGTGIEANLFWKHVARIVTDFSPKNKELLEQRESLQAQIDNFHTQRSGQSLNMNEYKSFLSEIGYLVPEGKPFKISTSNVDKEIAQVAGPQLVVPVNNARFALNAANARWGSLYDALYGTDVIEQGEVPESGFSTDRAKQVIQWSMDFLDEVLPLVSGSHNEVTGYSLADANTKKVLVIELGNGESTSLADCSQFAGYHQSDNEFTLLFINNGLHIELKINPLHFIGKLSSAGVKDVILESALSTIMDCEDSVAAVDAEDKVKVYRNWLGLMKGNLKEIVSKNGQVAERILAGDRNYISPEGDGFDLPGCSLMLVRNVGHLMTTDAVLDADSKEVPEGILDAMVTTLCALHDLRQDKVSRNSRHGSIYIVKPKMHGPEEVAFTDQLFCRVEEALGLEEYTIKVGVMDEERRTSANLKECIRAVKNRLFFINTGFLDRTGDEIHTSMHAGAVVPKDEFKCQPWISAYEDRNMDVGLNCGLPGKAQIGKGMWALPDAMKSMLEVKRMHPEVGASCAWVPSPTAATLHATHYHQINATDSQARFNFQAENSLEQLLTPPLLSDVPLEVKVIQHELENNLQSILGYVVRWVEQGIGCSKVPDINDVSLMEDRATLRISSQLLANWVLHGICSESQVLDTLKRMAVVVDAQNAGDPAYRKIAPDFSGSIAFQAACDLVFKGSEQPNGYTELLLHQRRREVKASKVN
ncbi:malate synthase G [Amphritea sp. HPY]|uniref:malate synthase G n=1 Tax=Amphritea sp. HPY TaxID=3421652 RepID=UPI003D7E9051